MPERERRLAWEQVLAWRMARHHLLVRSNPQRLARVAGEVCGLHAQVMSSAQLSAWARIDNLPPDAVDRALWQRRTLVKLWAARGTLHLLPATDVGTWLAALSTQTKFGNAGGGEMNNLTAAIGAALDGRVLSRDDLADEVARITGDPSHAEKIRFSWGSWLKAASFRGLICFARSDGNRVRFTSVETWLRRKVDRPDPHAALREITLRYLAAYAPATPEQVAGWWVGPPTRQRGKRMLDALGGDAVEVSVDGTPAWALPQDVGEMSRGGLPDMARLLPAFDPWTIGVPRHLPVLDPAYRSRVFRPQGWISPVLAVNGRIAGVWRHTHTDGRVTVELEPFNRLPPWACRQLDAEARRLAAHLGADLTIAVAG